MSPASSDSDLSALDWILAIMCCGVGCIVGLVYMIQGNPKGGKMLLTSLVAGAIVNVIIFAGIAILSPNR
jgi:hypothetical protein